MHPELMFGHCLSLQVHRSYDNLSQLLRILNDLCTGEVYITDTTNASAPSSKP